MEVRIGIDVGGTKTAYGLFHEGNTLIDRHQHPTPIDIDGPGLCKLLLEGIRTLLERNGIDHASVEGVGIGMPSFIFYERGYIYMTSALVNVKEFAMRDYMAQRLDIPVVLDNDSNGAALAEYRYGAGRGSRHMIYMSASTGLGSGLILTLMTEQAVKFCVLSASGGNLTGGLFAAVGAILFFISDFTIAALIFGPEKMKQNYPLKCVNIWTYFIGQSLLGLTLLSVNI